MDYTEKSQEELKRILEELEETKDLLQDELDDEDMKIEYDETVAEIEKVKSAMETSVPEPAMEKMEIEEKVEEEEIVEAPQENMSSEELKSVVNPDLFFSRGGTTKYEFGIGGTLAGAVVGGYVGYKIGRARPQKTGFDTEKRIFNRAKSEYQQRMKKKDPNIQDVSYEEVTERESAYPYANGGLLEKIRKQAQAKAKRTGNTYLVIQRKDDKDEIAFIEDIDFMNDRFNMYDNWEVIEAYKTDYNYAKGGALEKEFKFDKNFVIYVPSTSDVGKKISQKELDARVDEVEKYVANLFGGYTETDTDGGYKSTTGEIIEEDIVKVSVFANNKDWKKNEKKVVSKVKDWAKRWGQEAIGFEYEGDLYYIDDEGKFAKGVFIKDNYWGIDEDELKEEKQLDLGKWYLYYNDTMNEWEATMDGNYTHTFKSLDDLMERKNEIDVFEYNEKLSEEKGEEVITNSKGEIRKYAKGGKTDAIKIKTGRYRDAEDIAESNNLFDYAERKGASLDYSSGWEDEIDTLLEGTNYESEKVIDYYKHRGKKGEVNWNDTYVIVKKKSYAKGGKLEEYNFGYVAPRKITIKGKKYNIFSHPKNMTFSNDEKLEVVKKLKEKGFEVKSRNIAPYGSKEKMWQLLVKKSYAKGGEIETKREFIEVVNQVIEENEAKPNDFVNVMDSINAILQDRGYEEFDEYTYDVREEILDRYEKKVLDKQGLRFAKGGEVDKEYIIRVYENEEDYENDENYDNVYLDDKAPSKKRAIKKAREIENNKGKKDTWVRVIDNASQYNDEIYSTTFPQGFAKGGETATDYSGEYRDLRTFVMRNGLREAMGKKYGFEAKDYEDYVRGELGYDTEVIQELAGDRYKVDYIERYDEVTGRRDKDGEGVIIVSKIYEEGGKVKRFDRHESMPVETRDEIGYLINGRRKEIDGVITYVDSGLMAAIYNEHWDREQRRELDNYLYGLYDGYNYSHTENFKKLLSNLKKSNVETANRVEKLFNEVDKYPKPQNTYEYKKGGFFSRLFGGKSKKSEKAKKLRRYTHHYIISDKKGKPIYGGESSYPSTSQKEAQNGLKKSLQDNIDSGYYKDGDKIEIFTPKQYKESKYFKKGYASFEKGGLVYNDIYDKYPSSKYYISRTQLQDWTPVKLKILEKTGEKTSSGRDIYKDNPIKTYIEKDGLYFEEYAKGGETGDYYPKLMEKQKAKLDEAIKHFEDKIKKQGRITNARDEEHLSRLKELRKSYAKGGETASPITNYRRNIMGTLSFDLKVKGMRKAQDFIVYPITGETDKILIQSDKKFGYIFITSGIGILSKSGNKSYNLQADMMNRNVIRFELTKEELKTLIEKIKETSGKNVGRSFVKSDNSGAELLARGGELMYEDIDIYKDADDNYTVFMDGDVYDMNEYTMPNMSIDMYVGSRFEFPADISHLGRKIKYDDAPIVIQDKISNRIEYYARGGALK